MSYGPMHLGLLVQGETIETVEALRNEGQNPKLLTPEPPNKGPESSNPNHVALWERRFIDRTLME